MGAPIPVFKGSMGLNNKIDPVRLVFDPKTGVQDLAVAYNVDHDATGRISRRKGFSATSRTESIQSLFCDGGECLFVTGTSLCVLHSDFSYTSLVTVSSGARVAYLQIHNQIFWMNGVEKGYVQNSVNNSWVKGTYRGPTTTRQYSDPPIGTKLAHFGGCILVAQGNVIWHSEPFSLNAFDLVRNYLPFQTEVRMIRPVKDGIYVSTERNTYFLEGTTIKALNRIKVAPYPAIEWTDTKVDLSKLGSGEMTGIGGIWTSTEGICVGLPGGQFINLTRNKITYPNAKRGSGLVLGDRYIGLLEP